MHLQLKRVWHTTRPSACDVGLALNKNKERVRETDMCARSESQD